MGLRPFSERIDRSSIVLERGGRFQCPPFCAPSRTKDRIECAVSIRREGRLWSNGKRAINGVNKERDSATSASVNTDRS